VEAAPETVAQVGDDAVPSLPPLRRDDQELRVVSRAQRRAS
jgi:hypothetical protein